VRQVPGRPEEIRGTAFAISSDGLFLTAGHVFGAHSPERGFFFSRDGVSIPLKSEHIAFDSGTGDDYAICRSAKPVVGLDYVALSFPRTCKGSMRLRGYGVVGGAGQKDAVGSFIGTADRKTTGGRIFLFQSDQAGSPGFSGSGVYADVDGGVTAIQTEAAAAPIGPSWNTVFAYPLFRIRQELRRHTSWRTRSSWWLRSLLRSHRTAVVVIAILPLLVLPIAAVRFAVTGWFMAAYNDPIIVEADEKETMFWTSPEIVAMQKEAMNEKRSHEDIVALIDDELRGEILKLNAVNEQLAGCLRSNLCEPIMACTMYYRMWNNAHIYAKIWDEMRAPPFNQDLIRNQEFVLVNYCASERDKACDDSNQDGAYCNAP